MGTVTKLPYAVIFLKSGDQIITAFADVARLCRFPFTGGGLRRRAD